MLNIEINGQAIQAAPGSTIIEIADANQIYIPRFCYHKKLSVAANCRMCLVEVERSNKPLPACATPITEGMKIWTKSAATQKAQHGVLEFLLINHPLDCPICDQAGECELQDLSLSYGLKIGAYRETKRAVAELQLGPLIGTHLTRCIQCTRCVRFGRELAGTSELGALDRGENMQISAFLEQALSSEVAGNIIDLCPVGALVAKPSTCQARSWELIASASISPHDCLGSNLAVHSWAYRAGRPVLRVVPKLNYALNEMWLADRDRFSYVALTHNDRLLQPQLKTELGVWQELTWSAALDQAATWLQAAQQLKQHNIAALVSPNSSVEELLLWQQLARCLNIRQINSLPWLQNEIAKPQAFEPELLASQRAAWLATTKLAEQQLQSFADQQIIIILGAYTNKEAPLLTIKLNQFLQDGGKLVIINPVNWELGLNTAPGTAGEVVRLVPAGGDLLAGWQQAEALPLWQDSSASNILVLMGEYAWERADFAAIWASLQAWQQRLQVLGKNINYLTLSPGANSLAASLLLPQSEEPLLMQQLMKAADLQIWWQLEPGWDLPQSPPAGTKVIAVAGFVSQELLAQADLILPAALFLEQTGTYVNCFGRAQIAQAASIPLGAAKPGAWILHELLQRFGLDSVSVPAAASVVEQWSAILQEYQAQAENCVPVTSEFPVHANNASSQAASSNIKSQAFIANTISNGLQLLISRGLYDRDMVLRRSAPLQQTLDAGMPVLYLNPQYMDFYGFKPAQTVSCLITENHKNQAGQSLKLSVCGNEQVPAGLAWLSRWTPRLGLAYAGDYELKFI